MIIEVYSFPSGKFSHIVIKHSPHGDRIMGCPPDSLFQESRSCGWPSCQASQESIARSEISNFQFSTFVVYPFLAALDKNNHFGHDTFPISTSGVLSGHPHSWTLLLSPSLDPSPYPSSKQLYILLSSSDWKRLKGRKSHREKDAHCYSSYNNKQFGSNLNVQY